MASFDILEIDIRIRDELSGINVDKYIKIRDEMSKAIAVKNSNLDKDIVDKIQKEMDRLGLYITELQNNYNINFYISDTVHFIEDYKRLLKVPKKMNFIGKLIETDNQEKYEILNGYLKASSKYTNITHEKIVVDVKCFNCHRNLEYEILEDSTFICSNCSSEQGSSIIVSSFSDAERVNISSKYSYDRKTHFRECVSQYHGKQNVIIPAKVYTDLDKSFLFHGLVDGTVATPRFKRYTRVSKKVVLMFLKELGYSKHYENLNLIHSVVTDSKLDDISHLMDLILDDFDALSELYDRKFTHVSRKNFINTQYVLFQLLRKHGHDCDKEDFTNLKTVDRKFFHEEIIKKLFQDLGWNYVSIF
jgi:hypothetical protein